MREGDVVTNGNSGPGGLGATEPFDERLRAFGYAPGGYLRFCGQCSARHCADKRAYRCEPCARVELAATLAQPVVREAPSVRGATMAEVMAGYARVVLAADDWEEARAAALRAIATHESRERVAILFGLLGDKEGDLQRAVRASRGGEG